MKDATVAWTQFIYTFPETEHFKIKKKWDILITRYESCMRKFIELLCLCFMFITAMGFNVYCTDTLCPSNIATTSKRAGSAAEKAVVRKNNL